MADRRKDLRRMNVGKLQDLAAELQIVGRSTMTKEDLIEVILEAEQAATEQEPEDQEEPDTEPAPPPAAEESQEPGGVAVFGDETVSGVLESPKGPTEEEYRRIHSASTERLHLVLQDPELEQHLAEAIRRELNQRHQSTQEAAARAQLATEVEQFVVTEGGRFIIDSYITALPAGSLITRNTHDLAEVERQGIRFKPATKVEITHDQMGNQIARAT